MPKLCHPRKSLFLSALAFLCASGALCAQEEIGAPDADSVVLTEKQATEMVLVQTKPEYPAVAKVNYLQGHVQLRLTVDGDGKVTKAHVVVGDAVLAASALKAVRSWTYRPLATSAGPVGFVTIVKVKYFLSSTPAATVAELSPRRAEGDFLRQVKPPQVLSPPENTHSGDSVRLRLLVNEQGKVDDIEISPTSSRPQARMAMEDLRSWTFRPARWGNLPIASYLDVDVPVNMQSIARIASSHGNR